MTDSLDRIGAVVLAAGLSTRMGQPKLILPWGKHTIIEQVVSVIRTAGVERIALVTGGARDQIESLFSSDENSINLVFNDQFQEAGMLVSLQTGMRVIMQNSDCRALLVVLGDQPQLIASTITEVTRVYFCSEKPIVIPSYQMRRGHPWLIDRSLWEEILKLPADRTMRDFLILHNNHIAYAEVTSATILSDLDTPEDYRRITGAGVM